MKKIIKITTIDKFKNFLLFLIVFFFGFFLFFLKPQIIKASGWECNNGPSNTDAGGCGTPCHCGNPWSLYNKDINLGQTFCEIVGTSYYYVDFVSNICPTGDVCIQGEKGLRMGYCDCSFGPIYKACCQGSTPVACVAAPGYDPKWLKGQCPPGSTTTQPGVTTCSSAPTPTSAPGPTSAPAPGPTSAPAPTPTSAPAPSGGIIMCQLIKPFHFIRNGFQQFQQGISSVFSSLIHLKSLKSEAFANWKIK